VEEQRKEELGLKFKEKPGPSSLIWCIAGFTVGTCAATFGIAGGLLLMPLMLHYDIPARRAIVTVNYILVYIALSSTIQFYQMGFFDVQYFLLFCVVLLIANIVSIRWINSYV
jgi:uncharacterized membrane protein YfcA